MVLCAGVEAGVKGQTDYEPLDTMTSVHQMGVRSLQRILGRK